MTMSEVVLLTTRLISFAVVLQGIEILLLKKYWSEKGIWNWEALREDYRQTPGVLLSITHFLLKEKVFVGLVVLQIILAVANIIDPHARITLWILMLSIIQLSRWRGFFNGGSDSMTFVILLSCVFMGFFLEEQKIQLGFLWYIALQATLSYFVAGVSKAKSKSWWNGKELSLLMTHTSYAIPMTVKNFLNRPLGAKLASLGLILFECSFPLAFINKQFAIVYLSAAVIFHLINFYVLGLNRFFFAWIAAYPAIYFLS